ncbi:HD domain-containing protein [Gillisia sp. M10.2A]|uniref:HD domain-containing protein n=1 Tax=Gillisia lutea TaxID=2909668 RepID=A0ABS9ED26_9FLAO|nr:HD domain-containing protein [Gillisia lutea]MCF4100757.1 HD domain-containing protein [Gillisia lutea]
MLQEEVIQNTIRFVKDTLKDAEGGHDWFHIQRVLNNAELIAASEEVNMFIVKLGALLHDIADSKFHDGDEYIGPETARSFLLQQEVSEEVIMHVIHIIENISFKGGKEAQKFKSPELNVIQDADRLDALGAIGIARAFNYGGFKGRGLYDPAIKPNLHMTKEEYKTSSAPTLNHFYEKLLLLKDRMNTETGKALAIKRSSYMNSFLDQFYDEWNGKS